MPMFHAEAQALLNYSLKGTAYTPATTGYLVLCTQPVTADDVSVTEASFTGYVRQQITFADADTGGNSIKNSAVVTFPANTLTTNTIVAIVVSADASGGPYKYFTNLCKPIVHAPGDPVLSWAIGALTIRLGSE